ncbi:hypothetical protein EF514_06315 [Anaerosphaera multitolerans]|uniref:Uncharacterized protein n=1 Tax=Anaerosphaera multitolerans TaxID=2487351 RepID=A0A437S6T6_9FIRM|nr:hypothetical protein EF514_06315 [Anaerosphaera multitolerans]
MIADLLIGIFIFYNKSRKYENIEHRYKTIEGPNKLGKPQISTLLGTTNSMIIQLIFNFLT